MMRLHMWGLRKSRRKLIKNNEKLWKCPHCEKFLTIPKVLFHLLVHSLEKPFRCCECRTRFADQEHFDEHRRKHEEERLNAKRALARDRQKSIQSPKKKRSRASEASELQVIAVKPGYVYRTVTTRSGRAVRQMIPLVIKKRSKPSSGDVAIPIIKNEQIKLTKSEDDDTFSGRIYCGLCPKSCWGLLQLKLHLQTDHSSTILRTGNNTEQQEETSSRKEVKLETPELTGNRQLCRKIMTKYRKLSTVHKRSDGSMNAIDRKILLLKPTLKNSVTEPPGNSLLPNVIKVEGDWQDLRTNGPASQGRTLSHAFRCTYCPLSFVNLYEYQLHVADHEGLPKFDCHMCNSSFLAENHLRSHLNAIHKISATS